MRLDKLLANKAFGSRKEVHQIIKDGRVTVNGAVILKKDQSIHIDDESLQLMVYKYQQNNSIILNFINLLDILRL